MQYFNYSTAPEHLNKILMVPSLQGFEERVIVGISDTTLAKAGLINEGDLNFREKQRIAGALATLAYRLSLPTYDFIDWIATDPHFNREAIAHYAKDHFGMRRLKQHCRST